MRRYSSDYYIVNIGIYLELRFALELGEHRPLRDAVNSRRSINKTRIPPGLVLLTLHVPLVTASPSVPLRALADQRERNPACQSQRTPTRNTSQQLIPAQNKDNQVEMPEAYLSGPPDLDTAFLEHHLAPVR